MIGMKCPFLISETIFARLFPKRRDPFMSRFDDADTAVWMKGHAVDADFTRPRIFRTRPDVAVVDDEPLVRPGKVHDRMVPGPVNVFFRTLAEDQTFVFRDPERTFR